ncbi:hypothetical protein GCM10023162_15780 [Klenkia terrae]
MDNARSCGRPAPHVAVLWLDAGMQPRSRATGTHLIPVRTPLPESELVGTTPAAIRRRLGTLSPDDEWDMGLDRTRGGHLRPLATLSHRDGDFTMTDPPRAWRIDDTHTDGRYGEPWRIWRAWAEVFDRTGVWPVTGLAGAYRDESEERLPHADPVGDPRDAAEVLATCWEGARLVRPDGTLLPHPSWPGLAAPVGEQADQVRIDEVPCGPRLALVPAPRPADVPARLGWTGACNWHSDFGDRYLERRTSASQVSGVLRSWEDRFGAYLVQLGFADLDLVVTRPPTDDDTLRLLANEHYAFCPDNFAPQTYERWDQPPYTAEQYAALLRGATTWHFWWD